MSSLGVGLKPAHFSLMFQNSNDNSTCSWFEQPFNISNNAQEALLNRLRCYDDIGLWRLLEGAGLPVVWPQKSKGYILLDLNNPNRIDTHKDHQNFHIPKKSLSVLLLTTLVFP